MHNPSTVRFQLVWLPDLILAKLIEGFRQSDCAICAALVEQLSQERARRSRGGSAMVEVTLPLVSPGDAFDAKAGLLAISAAMLEAGDGDHNTLESPSGYQIAAEFVMSVIHAIERQEFELQFSAVTTAN